MKLLFFILLCTSAFACDGLLAGSGTSSKKTKNNDQHRYITPGSYSPQSGEAWMRSGEGLLQNQSLGVLKCRESAQGHVRSDEIHIFNDHLRKILSTTRNPSLWPQNQVVKCSKEGGAGGALFRGRIDFQNGASFSPSNHEELQVSTSSILQLYIIDWHGRAMAQFQMRAVQGQSIDSNAYITLTFEDSKGRVTMEGGIDINNNFSGKFHYQNYKSWNGSSSNLYSGTLGYFTVKTCGFFRCPATTSF